MRFNIEGPLCFDPTSAIDELEFPESRLRSEAWRAELPLLAKGSTSDSVSND